MSTNALATVTLPYKIERKPPKEDGYALQYPESLVRFFLKEFTKKDAKVLDPFAGLGTTLFVAEEMGRVPYGVEYDARRHEWVAGQLKRWQSLVCGDSKKLSSFGFPKMDFCMSCPPYMARHHKWNPLRAGNPKGAGYETYLRDLQGVYKQVALLMKKGARVVVQADNMMHGKIYTPLVRDISAALSEIMTLESEIIVRWENPPPADYRHAREITHCLLFRSA